MLRSRPDSPEDARFRSDVRQWLTEQLTGPFGDVAGAGGPGREHEAIERRSEWERALGAAGWIGVGWPTSVGGRGVSTQQQAIFVDEYARAGGPARVNHVGEQLLGPTLLMFGSPEQQQRYLPGVLAGTDMWCQGYSEPNAGSDLANVQTRAERRGDSWVINGQKVWTSLAQFADWIFVLARYDAQVPKHQGLIYLLVDMRQPGVQIRPIVQATGTAEFNEVFFSDAVAADVVGQPGDGWKVAMGTLAQERGVATIGQQAAFRAELDAVIDRAKVTGAWEDPRLRAALVKAWTDLEVVFEYALHTLELADRGEELVEPSISKMLWSNWHRDLGKLALAVEGVSGMAVGAGYELTLAQQLFLYTRADTIYAGSNEIQRNIIAKRGLHLPNARTTGVSS